MIPTELGQLNQMSMSFFRLESNSLTGPTPTELGMLSKLRDISLGENWLSLAIPTELGNLDALKEGLNLGENAISSTIPSELGNLGDTLLMDFLLSENSLTGSIPTELRDLSKVTGRMEFHFNKLTADIPSGMDTHTPSDATTSHSSPSSATMRAQTSYRVARALRNRPTHNHPPAPPLRLIHLTLHPGPPNMSSHGNHASTPSTSPAAPQSSAN